MSKRQWGKVLFWGGMGIGCVLAVVFVNAMGRGSGIAAGLAAALVTSPLWGVGMKWMD